MLYHTRSSAIYIRKIFVISRICREAPREPICMKIGTVGRLADIINCAKFCDDKIRVFDSTSTRGRISAIPIDLGCRR